MNCNHEFNTGGDCIKCGYKKGSILSPFVNQVEDHSVPPPMLRQIQAETNSQALIVFSFGSLNFDPAFPRAFSMQNLSVSTANIPPEALNDVLAVILSVLKQQHGE